MKWFATLALVALASPAWALAPSEIILVANKNVPDSKVVAEYYCAKRGVPKSNVIYLDLTTNEDIGRSSYDTNLAGPLRKALLPKKDKVKLILTVYGVPLRVGATTPSPAEKAEMVKLQPQMDEVVKQRDATYAKITALSPKAASDANVAKEVAALKTQYAQLASKFDALNTRKRWIAHLEAVASVDSELANLWSNTDEFRSYQLSPLYFRAAAKSYQPTIMTCRLDGPSVTIVKGLIDKAVAVEAKGLTGKAYFDARGLKFDLKADPRGQGYAALDESIREAAALFTKTNLPTTLDNKPNVFPPNSCPDCALYCGWYSHAKYVASNQFVPGAVAYHVASSEAVSLRRKDVNFWCKRMLDDGVTATLGPVAEPYVQAFPKPAEFFGFLATGATLAESYWSSNPYASWMMVLVGDPLYRPFAKAPKWKTDAVVASPKGVK